MKTSPVGPRRPSSNFNGSLTRRSPTGLRHGQRETLSSRSRIAIRCAGLQSRQLRRGVPCPNGFTGRVALRWRLASDQRVPPIALAPVGLLLVVLAIAGDPHSAAEVGFASLLVIGGVCLMVVAAAGADLKRFRFNRETGVDVEWREREASAAAAAAGTSPDAIEKRIESDDLSPPQRSELDPEIIGYSNFTAASLGLEAIFAAQARSGPLSGSKLRLYLRDDDSGLLQASLESAVSTTAWAPGRGATGAAYEEGALVVAEGDAVWDETFGLTAEEREQFKDLKAVASCPVFSASGHVIGVVTASSEDEDTQIASEEGIAELQLLSLISSRYLIELLQWFEDFPES